MKSDGWTNRRTLRGQDGQSLAIVVLAMFIVLGMAAVAIDMATWYQKHHQAQVSADAAALAAANCLVDASSTVTTNTNMCTTPSDTTRASNVATTIARTNSIPIAGSVGYGFGANGTITSVTVTTATRASTFFGSASGIASPNVSARSVASVNWSFTDCSHAGTGCLMFYAASNTTCTSNTASITIQGGNSVAWNGGIFTNGNISQGGNGGNFYGPVTYGAGTPCDTNTNIKSNATFNDGTPVQQTSDYGTTASPNWLIDYSTKFPACGSGSQYQCTGTSGTPSYCNYAAASFTAYQGPGVYCAYGTSTTKSNPATWTGSISFPSAQGSSSSPLSVTLIGGTVSLSSNSWYKAYSNNLLVYATSTSSTAFQAAGGGLTWTGDAFVPNGGASLTGGNVNFTGFVQAQTINDQGGSQTGAGPSFTGGGMITGAGSTLSQ